MLRPILLSMMVTSLAAYAAEQKSKPETAGGYGQPVERGPEPAKGSPRISVSSCNVEGPYVAITFDDGPHGSQTPRLLKMLKERGIKATFFVVGQCVAEYPEIARQIVTEGHEIANHSWSHPQLTKLGETPVRDQIGRTHNVIKQTTGVEPLLLRPPYGAFTTQQRAWAAANWNYKTILWDVDSLDWKHRSPAKTESIILSETHKGSIILCHDIHKTTVDAMPATLDALRAKGFKFVTVTDLMAMHREPSVQKPAVPAKSLTPKDATNAASTIEELRKQPVPAGEAPAIPPSGPTRQ